MRLAAFVALAFIASVGLASQEKLTREDLLGKTEAQVLAMGHAAWMELHSKTHGESTAALSGGSMIFAQCLRNRNDALLAKKPVRQRANLAKIRPLLTEFTDQIYHVGTCFSGGGTMWNIFWSGARVTEEETFYGVLTGLGKKPPARVISDGTKKMDILEASLVKRRSDIEVWESEVMSFQSAMDALAKARITYSKLMDVAKNLDRAGSDRLIDFCLSQTRVPLEIGGA